MPSIQEIEAGLEPDGVLSAHLETSCARIAEFEEERKELIAEMHRLAVAAVDLERVQGVLVGALGRLSAACDKRCELLSREAYLSSLKCPGMSEALQDLDDARLNALAALAAAQKPEGGE